MGCTRVQFCCHVTTLGNGCKEPSLNNPAWEKTRKTKWSHPTKVRCQMKIKMKDKCQHTRVHDPKKNEFLSDRHLGKTNTTLDVLTWIFLRLRKQCFSECLGWSCSTIQQVFPVVCVVSQLLLENLLMSKPFSMIALTLPHRVCWLVVGISKLDLSVIWLIRPNCPYWKAPNE